MSKPFWLLLAAVAVAMCATFALAMCTTACDGNPVYSPSDLAQQRCIDAPEAGIGKAAMKKAIDDCRAQVLLEAGK